MQNNTLSRAELSDENGYAKNVHYGDILIKYGDILDVNENQISMIADENILSKYKGSFLQNGDIVVADTAEDETVGKCVEIANLRGKIVLSGLHTIPFRPTIKFASAYLGYYMNSTAYHDQLIPLMQGTKVTSISKSAIQNTNIFYPKSMKEQSCIGLYFKKLDNLITLHQREPHNKMEDNKMLDNINNQILFCDYYEKWIEVYKEGAIRKVTLEKYHMTHRWLKKLIPELKICDLTRINYQQLLNEYAEFHERQTTMDFHHQLKGAILDAVDEGLLDRDPTRKAIIKGKTPSVKKIKYINQFELHTLLNNLNLKCKRQIK